MKWGEIVRTLRRSHGGKQDAFSHLIGVNQATISRWESGSQMPGPAHQELLLNLYNRHLRQDPPSQDAPGNDGALALAVSLANCRFIGMVEADEHRILKANDAFLTMLGHDRATLESGALDWRILTPPDSPTCHRPTLDIMRQTGRFPPLRKTFRHTDGHAVPVLLVGTVENRSPLRVVASIIDLSECRPPLPVPVPQPA